jgi:DNA-directed RNA polymerase subunit RPC12/RpoP
MSEKQQYECKDCGRKAETSDSGAAAPECCGKTMAKAEPLPFCEMSSTAEHARADDFGEPCDDGRGNS